MRTKQLKRVVSVTITAFGIIIYYMTSFLSTDIEEAANIISNRWLKLAFKKLYFVLFQELMKQQTLLYSIHCFHQIYSLRTNEAMALLFYIYLE